MKRLIIKVILNRLAHTLISLSILGIGNLFYPISHSTAFILESIIIALFQIPMYLIYRICPLKSRKHKKIYWWISISFTVLTALFWMVFVVGPLWL